MLICPKPLCIMFDKVDGFVVDYDGTKYLVLFGLETYDAIYDRIKYLNNITFGFSYDYAKIKIHSDDDLPLEKTFDFV